MLELHWTTLDEASTHAPFGNSVHPCMQNRIDLSIAHDVLFSIRAPDAERVCQTEIMRAFSPTSDYINNHDCCKFSS